MKDRDQAKVHELAGRISSVEKTGDPTLLVDAAAAQILTDLQSVISATNWNVPTAGFDELRSVYVVAMALLLRSSFAIPEQQVIDLRAAMAAFAILLDHVPDWIPAEIRAVLNDARGGDVSRGATERFIETLSLMDEYQQNHDPNDLEIAIASLQAQLPTTPPQSQLARSITYTLAAALTDRYKLIGADEDGREATAHYSRLLNLVPRDDPQMPDLLINFSRLTLAIGQWNNGHGHLDAAITLARAAVQLSQLDNPRRPQHLQTLHAYLLEKFEKMGANETHDDQPLEVVNEAIAVCRTWISQTEDKSPIGLRGLLGRDLLDRFRLSHDPADLDEAITLTQIEARASAPGSLELAETLANLSLMFTQRFESRWQYKDLTEAAEVATAASSLLPPSSPEAAQILVNLASMRNSLFELNGDLGELRSGIVSVRRALHLTTDPLARSAALHNLSSLAKYLYDFTGDAESLDEAICAGYEMAKTTTDETAFRLSNLASALLARFELTGSRDDLNSAVTFGRRACRGPMPDQDPWSNLNGFLRARFDLDGELSDIQEAVAVGRRAVQACPEQHPGLPFYLNNLAASLGRLYRETGDDDVRRETLAVNKRLIAIAPDGHANNALFRSNMAAALTQRPDANELGTIDEAIEVFQQLTEDPANVARRPIFLANLASMLLERFDVGGDQEDLARAARSAAEAVETSAVGQPMLATHWLNVGRVARRIYTSTESAVAAEQALAAFQQASLVNGADASLRLNAALRWAELATELGQHEVATRAYESAINLLPVVSWPGLSTPSRERRLSAESGLASAGAAAALQVGNVASAVSMLELGRTLLWTHMLNLNGYESNLSMTHPDLAMRLAQVATKLKGLGNR